MTKAIFICIAALSLIACATTRSTENSGGGKRLRMRDVAWLSALLAQPQKDANRACLDSSLQTAFALLALKDSEFDDKYIETALLNNLPNEKVRRLRKADFLEWKKTHEPSIVAAKHLNMCLATAGNALSASDVWTRCFLSAEPAAMLSIYKRSAQPLSSAVQAVIPYYSISANAAEIEALAQQVYALPSATDELNLREQIFVGCLTRK